MAVWHIEAIFAIVAIITILIFKSVLPNRQKNLTKRAPWPVNVSIAEEEAKQRELECQERLKEMAEEANRANSAKSDFLARMSHDIRTPINGIQGMLDIIEKCRDDEEQVNNCLSKIRTASAHLLSLINDILDMSKLESGAIILAHEPFDLRKVFNECVVVTESMALDNGVSLKADWESSIEYPYLMGSPLHLRQILINLISNAIKYNHSGGTVWLNIEKAEANEAMVSYRFTISDTGIGMSEEFLTHAFEPFTQEHFLTSSRHGSTGLGLAIVKKVVDLMHGDIRVSSKVGEGSVFTVQIPFELDQMPSAHQDSESYPVPETFDGVRVLLAEDNELNQEIAQFILEDAGASVEIADNGQIAVSKFQSSPPGTYQVILMDMMMPVMDGLQASRYIRALKHEDAKTIPIIAMTANAFAEDAKKCRDAGMNDHIAKPVDSRAMLHTITKHLPTKETH